MQYLVKRYWSGKEYKTTSEIIESHLDSREVIIHQGELTEKKGLQKIELYKLVAIEFFN